VVDAEHAFVACRRKITRVIVMLDFLMVAGGVTFFVVAILYVLACEKM
jgi:peptidase E